jgi:protein arginine N-methyltransferase 2
MGFIDTKVTFNEHNLTIPARGFSNPGDVEHVMMDWEDELMLRSAEWVCSGGGHILEIGFGMGISANHIQSYNIDSHTIVECHPDIIPKALEWANGRNNVTIVQGEWYKMRHVLGKYDGVFYDAYGDEDLDRFSEELGNLCSPGAKVTWWNNFTGRRNYFGIEVDDYQVIEVNPPENSYFNFSTYYMPKKITLY